MSSGKRKKRVNKKRKKVLKKKTLELKNNCVKDAKKDIEKVALEYEKKKRNRLVKKIILIILIIILICIVVFFGYKFYKRNEIAKKINDNIVIEYGEKLTFEYILKDNFKKVKVEPSLSKVKSVGVHELIFTIDGEIFKVKVKVQDTTPPDLEVRDIQKYLDEDLPNVDEFVENVQDLSKVDLKMSEIKKEVGEHDVEITATDKYNNKTTKKAKLTILEYKGSVKFTGLTTLSVEAGSKPDLKKDVLAKDDRFGELEFTVDNSKVNYNVPGTYKIYYKVIDRLGNETIMERIIKIKSKTYMIKNFPTYSQFPNYPNGCETVALYLMLKYYGVNVSVETLVNNLAKGDAVHWENDIRYGGNPEIEFVGNPRDKHGYGVYQKPIINLASKYKTGMVDYTGHSLNQVLNIVKGGTPVQVWVSINLKNTSVCADWIHKASGKKIEWICNLHSVVIVGFNDNYIYVSDPYVGSIKKYNRNQFQKMYNLFGKRAIYFK